MLEICTCHYNEDLTWLENCGYPVNIIHKEGGTPIDNPTFTIPNIGAEASAYLKFIIERYDTLPEHTAFLHGHETAYHQCGDRPMLDMIKTANIEKYDFIHLNNTWLYSSAIKQFYTSKEILESLCIYPPEYFSICPCAQFIVSKDFIKRNSKEYYEFFFKTIITKEDATMIEYIWQYIFTGKFSVLPRDDDFNPPIKEIGYADFAFRKEDIRFGYVGKIVPISQQHDIIHVNSKELYDYYCKLGTVFFIYHGDVCEYDTEKNVFCIHSSQLHQFISEYTQYIININKMLE